MSQLTDTLIDQLNVLLASGSNIEATELRAFQTQIVAALGQLETRARGSRVFTGELLGGQPDASLGLEGDLYVAQDSHDWYSFIDGQWVFLFNGEGRAGVFAPVVANQYGTHPNFTTQRALDIFLLQNSGAGTVAPVVTVPGMVRNLAAQAGDGQAVLTWLAPASTGGAAISSYTVRYRPLGASTWSVFGTTANLTATVTGLTNSQAYEFAVAATNSVGTGALSGAVQSTPVAATPDPGSTTPVEYALTNADFWDSTFNRAQGAEVFHSAYSYVKFTLPAGVHTFDVYVLANAPFTGGLMGIGVRVNGVMQTVPLTSAATAAWHTVTGLPEGADIEVVNGYVDMGSYTPMTGNNIIKIRIAGTFQLQAPTVPFNLVFLDGDSITTGAFATNVMTGSIPMLIREALRAGNMRVAHNGWSSKQLYHQYSPYVDRPAYITWLSARLNATNKNVWYCALGTNDIAFTSSIAEYMEYYGQLMTDLHKARPDVRQVVQVPTYRSATPWIADLQAAVRALAAARPWVYLVETDVVLADLDPVDGLHLTNAGQAKVAAAAIPIIAPSAAAPTITSFTPSTGGDGIPVTITGTNFLGATDVTIGDERVASFVINSNTQITATVAGTQRTGKIAVYGPGGQAYSVSSFVSQIQPISRGLVPAGSPDMLLTGTAEFANNRIQVYTGSGTAVVRGQGTAARIRYYEQFTVSGYSPLEIRVDNSLAYTIDADHSGVPVAAFAPYSDVTVPLDPATPHTVVVGMVQYGIIREIEFIQ